MSRRHSRNLRLALSSLVGVALWLLGAAILSAEAADSSARSLDAWRTSLNERLDQDLMRLNALAQAPRQPPPSVERNGREARESNRFLFPQLGDNRNERWLSPLAGILREQGLPPGLVGIVAVESGFNPLALSPKGARGLWQLMPETARRYGLVVSPDRDERLNPLKSTVAAARYLKDLYAQFRDWPLALAAYNAGEDRVRRSLERMGARDFWTLSRHSALPDETRRYVPAVLGKVAVPLSALSLTSYEVAFSRPLENILTPRPTNTLAQARILYATPSPILGEPGRSQ